MGSVKDLFGDTAFHTRDLFDVVASKAARDAGRDRVAGNNSQWMEGVISFIRSLPSGWIGLSEDIRQQYRGDPPKHHNAWGSVTTVAIRRGLLVETGVWRAASAGKSHARRMPEYRRV